MENDKLFFINKTDLVSNQKLEGYGKKGKSGKARMPIYLQNPRKTIQSKNSGDVTIRYDTSLNYMYAFNKKTGLYKRTDYLSQDCKETGVDVFAANFPHLIDVGIMGHCSHGKTGLCLKSGVQCYQNGLLVDEQNMSVNDFKKIAQECKGLTNQFALGGRGDPNEHENFEDILKICRENNIVPNYTTSGFNLSDKQIELSKKYCGAVAVSWYRNDYTISAISRLISAGVKTNVHFVLNDDTISEAINMLENNSFPSGINAVIFLTHKPVGLGQREKCLRYDDHRVKKIYLLIKERKYNFKVGIDGCFVVGMIASGIGFNMKCLDTCEAARFTCYIDSKLDMKPCSFDVDNKFAVNIKNMTIMDGWNSNQFRTVRNILRNGCPECEKNFICHGGCFLHREIVLCNNKNKYAEDKKYESNS